MVDLHNKTFNFIRGSTILIFFLFFTFNFVSANEVYNIHYDYEVVNFSDNYVNGFDFCLPQSNNYIYMINLSKYYSFPNGIDHTISSNCQNYIADFQEYVPINHYVNEYLPIDNDTGYFAISENDSYNQYMSVGGLIFINSSYVSSSIRLRIMQQDNASKCYFNVPNQYSIQNEKNILLSPDCPLANFVNNQPIVNNSSLMSGLVSYYALEETTGNTVIDSNKRINATTSNQKKMITGKINYGYENYPNSTLIGNGNLNISGTGERTFSIWLNPKTLEENEYFMQMGENSASKGFGVFFYGNKFYIWNSAGDIDTGYVGQNNTYQHFVVQYNGTYIKAYANGLNVLNRSKTLSTTNSPIRIGMKGDLSNSTNFYFDEVGIWNRTLSTTEISELYNSGNGKTFSNFTTYTYAPYKIKLISDIYMPHNNTTINFNYEDYFIGATTYTLNFPHPVSTSTRFNISPVFISSFGDYYDVLVGSNYFSFQSYLKNFSENFTLFACNTYGCTSDSFNLNVSSTFNPSSPSKIGSFTFQNLSVSNYSISINNIFNNYDRVSVLYNDTNGLNNLSCNFNNYTTSYNSSNVNNISVRLLCDKNYYNPAPVLYVNSNGNLTFNKSIYVYTYNSIGNANDYFFVVSGNIETTIISNGTCNNTGQSCISSSDCCGGNDCQYFQCTATGSCSPDNITQCGSTGLGGVNISGDVLYKCLTGTWYSLGRVQGSCGYSCNNVGQSCISSSDCCGGNDCQYFQCTTTGSCSPDNITQCGSTGLGGVNISGPILYQCVNGTWFSQGRLNGYCGYSDVLISTSSGLNLTCSGEYDFGSIVCLTFTNLVSIFPEKSTITIYLRLGLILGILILTSILILFSVSNLPETFNGVGKWLVFINFIFWIIVFTLINYLNFYFIIAILIIFVILGIILSKITGGKK